MLFWQRCVPLKKRYLINRVVTDCPSPCRSDQSDACWWTRRFPSRPRPGAPLDVEFSSHNTFNNHYYHVIIVDSIWWKIASYDRNPGVASTKRGQRCWPTASVVVCIWLTTTPRARSCEHAPTHLSSSYALLEGMCITFIQIRTYMVNFIPVPCA